MAATLNRPRRPAERTCLLPARRGPHAERARGTALASRNPPNVVLVPSALTAISASSRRSARSCARSPQAIASSGALHPYTVRPQGWRTPGPAHSPAGGSRAAPQRPGPSARLARCAPGTRVGLRAGAVRPPLCACRRASGGAQKPPRAPRSPRRIDRSDSTRRRGARVARHARRAAVLHRSTGRGRIGQLPRGAHRVTRRGRPLGVRTGEPPCRRWPPRRDARAGQDPGRRRVDRRAPRGLCDAEGAFGSVRPIPRLPGGRAGAGTRSLGCARRHQEAPADRVGRGFVCVVARQGARGAAGSC